MQAVIVALGADMLTLAFVAVILREQSRLERRQRNELADRLGFVASHRRRRRWAQ